MRLDDFRLALRPGNGLIARFAGTVLVVTSADWPGLPATDRLVELCEQGPELLAQRLATVVDEEGQKVPAFCALADDRDGLSFFVHGDAQVVLMGADPVM